MKCLTKIKFKVINAKKNYVWLQKNFEKIPTKNVKISLMSSVFAPHPHNPVFYFF